MKKGTHVWLVLSIVLSQTAWSQQKEVKSFSLKDAISYAKQYNQTLLGAKMDQEASAQKINEIRAIGLPQITASGRYTYTPQIPVIGIANPGFFGPEPFVRFPQGIDYTVNGTINASQLLFDGSFLMGLKAAKEFAMLSKFGVRKAEYDVENAVITAYCMVLITEESIVLTDANIATIEKTRNDIQAIAKAGLMEQTEYDRIDLTYSNLLIVRKQLVDGRALAYYALKMQMGMPVKDSIVISDNLRTLYDMASNEPEIAAQLDYSKRPDYMMLKQQRSMYELDKKRYQYGYAPSLAFFAQHQQNGFSTEFNEVFKTFYPGTFIGLNLNVPIFDGLDKHSKIQQAKINIRKTDYTLSMLENAIEMEVYTARTNYIRAKEQLTVLEKNMKLAETIYQRINIKYQNGLSSSLDVVTAEKDLKEAQRNYLNGIYDLLIARANLKKALGQ